MRNKRYLDTTWRSLRGKESLAVLIQLEINDLFSGKEVQSYRRSPT